MMMNTEHNNDADDEDSCDEEEDVKEMTKQRQQVADQEAVDGLPGRKVNSIGRINSINSNACHCPDASRSARLAIGI